MSNVGIVRMSKARRYRGELEGAWKCAATAKPKQTRTKKVAIGWTMRMEERECRVDHGNEKSLSVLVNSESVRS